MGTEVERRRRHGDNRPDNVTNTSQSNCRLRRNCIGCHHQATGLRTRNLRSEGDGCRAVRSLRQRRRAIVGLCEISLDCDCERERPYSTIGNLHRLWRARGSYFLIRKLNLQRIRENCWRNCVSCHLYSGARSDGVIAGKADRRGLSPAD